MIKRIIIILTGKCKLMISSFIDLQCQKRLKSPQLPPSSGCKNVSTSTSTSARTPMTNTLDVQDDRHDSIRVNYYFVFYSRSESQRDVLSMSALDGLRPAMPSSSRSCSGNMRFLRLNRILASSPTSTVRWQRMSVRQDMTSMTTGTTDATKNSLYVRPRSNRTTASSGMSVA